MADNAQGQPLLPAGPRALVTFSLALAVFTNVLDISIANVSIPTIAGELAVSSSQGTWIITSFAAANAVAVPISGWLAKRVGEVRLFVICTLLFTLFSFACGISFTFPMLLISRALQGAVAGPMIPLSQSLLLQNYPRHQHGFANGVWGMTAVVGPVAGPILGGWITDNFHWSWIFFINVPIGLFSAAITWTLLRDRETETMRLPIDLIGLGLLIVWVTALQIMMDKGLEEAWFQSRFIIALGVVAVVAMVIWVVWELTDERPVVDLRLFAQRNFSVASISMTFGYMAYFAGVVVFPLWLQNYHGYTATWAGIATSSLGIMGVVASPIIGRLADKFDVRVLVTIGMLLFAVLSFQKASFNIQASFMQLFLVRLPWGIGLACFFIPLITLAMSGMPSNQIASASGLFNFLRGMALSLGTSVSQTIWYHRSALHDQQLSASVTALDPATRQWLHQAYEIGMSQMQALAVLGRQISRQAFMLGLNDMYWLAGWLFLALIGLVWFSKRPG
ncbi:MAG: DHA2 family efflux MFS transporter permease subunit [Salinisphaera sp.]|nr:DHA2 family efflux MFS transporter permease subunit [Salinisphaera sp.]